QFFAARFERAADLPFDIHRNANAACTRQWLDARSDVYSVAINITASMNNITNVNSDFNLDTPLERHVVIALGQRALNFDCTLGRFQRAVKLDEKAVPDCFNLGAVEAGKDFT